MSSPRILVTGVGVHTSLGGAQELRTALGEGRCAARMHTLAEHDGFAPFPAAPAAPGSPECFLVDRKLLKYMSEVTRLALLAAGRALESARLLGSPELRREMGLFLATGPMAFDLDSVRPSLEACVTDRGAVVSELLGEGLRRCHPLMPFKMLLNMPLGLASIVFGLRGANGIYYPGAAQAGVPFETALRGLTSGRFERVLVGAAVQGVSLLPVMTLARLGRLALSLEAFAAGEGLAPADGAAFLVLETEASAAARGVQRLCTIAGAASGLALSEEAVARSRDEVTIWSRALSSAPRRIRSSSTGSPAEDAARAEAIARRWPEAYTQPRLDSAVGSLGATSLALGVVLAALDRAEGSEVDPVLVGCSDPEGGCAAVALS